MTKKEQRKFIAVMMICLTLIFAALFISVVITGRNHALLNCRNELDFLQAHYSDASFGSLYDRNFFVADAFSENNYSIKSENYSFSADIVDNIVIKAITKDFEYGHYSDCYYKKEFVGPTVRIFAADMNKVFAPYRQSTSVALYSFIIAIVLLFFIVWGLSVKIFSPIKESLNKQRKFISDASHELKTPLAIISANTDVLEQNSPYVLSIKKQVERLDFLVDDLLTLARMDEGQNNIMKEEFCVSEEVADVLLTFEALAYEKNKKLISDIMPDLLYKGDKEGLKRIAGILLDNAVKYSSDCGTILVTLKKSGQRIILTVKNDGSNVPDNLSDRIFERFFRDDSRSREYGGNGLGLSIAKNIATSNDWRISAESVYGKSMTITLIL